MQPRLCPTFNTPVVGSEIGHPDPVILVVGSAITENGKGRGGEENLLECALPHGEKIPYCRTDCSNLSVPTTRRDCPVDLRGVACR